MREDILNDRESTDLALFEKIKTNPQPDILDLWALSEKRFRAWRRIHDFPKLLAHFDKTLIMFKEWKEAQKLNNEIIINSDEISPFLENSQTNNGQVI